MSLHLNMSKPSNIIRQRAMDRLKPFTLKVSILEQEILNYLDELQEQQKNCNKICQICCKNEAIITSSKITEPLKALRICQDCFDKRLSQS